MIDLKKESLSYHNNPSPGKIEILPKKNCRTKEDLTLAYSPGVAFPCLEIEKDHNDSYKYTSRSNLVGVISNGTAVLGLGDIGAHASKPVMEGKSVLFKRFADIDAFDIEINEKDPEKLVEIIASLEPTFGGINLEDIKAPECFYIEEKLKKRMDIPVFHDDQHGTAIISGAAFLNALEIAGKSIDKVKVVFNGAGAAGIACATYYLKLGVKKENLVLCDSKGVVYKGRTSGMNGYKEFFASDTGDRSLADALKGADAFVGVSVKNALTPDMIKTMNTDPIIFALANPDPEITYELATGSRPDVIMATGRSDYPNQVNNVLGFPFIFRAALDTCVREINDEMKLAASHSLSRLAHEPVIDEVKRIYNSPGLSFGRQYIIPKPFDSRVFIEVSAAVAEAAMKSNAARVMISDIDEYKSRLKLRYEKSISRFL
jgi:malate dehydrogenase (oxaloacetate-decarboxylating)(NADP+)